MATTEIGRPRARLELDGSGSTEATVQVMFQSKGTRVSRSLIVLGVTLAILPVLFFIPPRSVWSLVALAVGLYLAWRYWKGGYYVIDFNGPCPHCGTELTLARGTPIRGRHSLECHGCHRHPELIVHDVDE